MVTVSPPVSPSVVARILMIQKPSVTAGTLESASCRKSLLVMQWLLVNFQPQFILLLTLEPSTNRADQARMIGVPKAALVGSVITQVRCKIVAQRLSHSGVKGCVIRADNPVATPDCGAHYGMRQQAVGRARFHKERALCWPQIIGAPDDCKLRR